MNVKTSISIISSIILGVTAANASPKHPPLEFLDMKMVYEFNSTDEDAEMVLYAKAPEGMRWFTALNPRGRGIADLYIPRKGNQIGAQQALIESAEPGVEEVKAAYPEGRYTFIGKTVSGKRVFGQVDFSHSLPLPPIINSCDDEVDITNAIVSWSVAGDVSNVVIEIENDDLGVALTFQLPGSTTDITLPAYLLESGIEYDIGVGAHNTEGNLVVSECSFSTL